MQNTKIVLLFFWPFSIFPI